MRKRVARVGDPGSHGGSIVTGARTATAEKRPIARIGDVYACPVHGPNPIVEGSAAYSIERRRVARIGDRTACGAVITDGSPSHRDET